MLTRFKARIETIETSPFKRGNIYIIDPEDSSSEPIVCDISKEVFSFSKEDIVFTLKQTRKYKNHLRLNSVNGSILADGVKYQLSKTGTKGRTKYIIDLEGSKAVLRLNWLNKGLIDWVHGRKINWNMVQAIAGVVGTLVVVVTLILQILSSKQAPGIINNTGVDKRVIMEHNTIDKVINNPDSPVITNNNFE